MKSPHHDKHDNSVLANDKGNYIIHPIIKWIASQQKDMENQLVASIYQYFNFIFLREIQFTI